MYLGIRFPTSNPALRLSWSSNDSFCWYGSPWNSEFCQLLVVNWSKCKWELLQLACLLRRRRRNTSWRLRKEKSEIELKKDWDCVDWNKVWVTCPRRNYKHLVWSAPASVLLETSTLDHRDHTHVLQFPMPFWLYTPFHVSIWFETMSSQFGGIWKWKESPYLVLISHSVATSNHIRRLSEYH